MDNQEFKIHVDMIGGNLYDSATYINKMGWAEYLVSMSCDAPYQYTIVVLRMPRSMVHKIRRESRSYIANVDHDDPINSWPNGQDIKYETIPDYGTVMSKQEFIDACNRKEFVDGDGIGNWATPFKMSNQEIKPSDIKDGELLDSKAFTHVVWFSK